ncbi:MAG: hypothetical protein Q4G25_13190 [Paracoccus sp. (in: a-proteobacteria)]|uniref:hypothetical protein n=1 Tax=Paracoccus sp. TaxID=267 RepID=UPI0026E0BD53|nr:hypothetical protein [Paracoccus sp. (in: a-proteobacteria)]MDO5606106.1 hypothetical protein [Paracoccus sp. (in: a-proteobacteria)]MDO5633189.1 hypothetical protein [Paracoccus sp. (in: a-proteobacteria)]
MTDIHSITDLIAAAAEALIARDTLRIEELTRISRDWLQMPQAAEAQARLLDAIMEAACLLEDEPSDLAA